MIAINRQATPKIELIGQAKVPIIVIDDYVENIDALTAEVAKNSFFKPDEITNYPGLRAPINKADVVSYLKPLMQVLYRVYQFPDAATPAPCDNYFSLITKQPYEISALQSWPHFDTTNPNLIAVIHYLGRGGHGGTGFFKHNKSRLDRIEAKNKRTFYAYANTYFESLNSQEFGYCDEQHSEFTCYKQIAYKPNRLIVFPGQLLHSTLVNVNTDISSNPELGRLTANMFVKFI